MNVVIIEDEKLAADRLEALLRDIDPGMEISARLMSVEASVDWLQKHTPDLIFLDIHLSDGLSFAIFDLVDVSSPIVFTTAYDQYAIKAFKVNSIDYLLKPVRIDELRASLRKYRTIHAGNRVDLEDVLRAVRDRTPVYRKRFLVSFADKIRKVETEEIAYFHAMEKSVFLTTAENKSYPVDFTLDALESLLDPAAFFRINRKMIVAFRAIRHMVPYSRSRIRIDLQPAAPRDIEALVSVERAAAFRDWMNT